MRLIRYKTPTYAPAAYPSLLDEMDRLFEAAFPNGGFDWKGQFPIDLYKDTDAFVVRAELPGFRKEDLAIDLADGVLTITGTQKTEGQPDVNVTRSVALPENIDVEKITAAYENGVLTVTLPKREEAKPRQVAIEIK
jgi:HSP20 family protein